MILVGYLAFILNVIGNLLLAHKNIAGWIIRFVTNVTWIIYAIQIEDGEPVVLNHLVFLAINSYGLVKWRSNGPSNTR